MDPWGRKELIRSHHHISACTLELFFVWCVQDVTANTFISGCSEVKATAAVAHSWAYHQVSFYDWFWNPQLGYGTAECSALSWNFCTCSIVLGGFIQRLMHWFGDLFIGLFAVVAKNCINVLSEIGNHLLKFQRVLQLSSSEIPENWLCPLALDL